MPSLKFSISKESDFNLYLGFTFLISGNRPSYSFKGLSSLNPMSYKDSMTGLLQAIDISASNFSVSSFLTCLSY